MCRSIILSPPLLMIIACYKNITTHPGMIYKYNLIKVLDKDVIMQAEDITEAEFYEREYEPGMARNRRC